MAKPKVKKEKPVILVYTEYLLFLVLFKTLETLPFFVSMKLAQKLMALLFVIDRKHSGRTVEHIIYSGVETDPAKAHKMARENFREYGKLLAEIAHMKKRFPGSRVRFTGSEEALKIVTPELNPGNRQIILASAHYGNWEMAGSAFTMLQQLPMTSLMRSFSNPLIGEKILANRRSEMHELVDKNRGLRPILQAINQGRTVTALVDQHAASAEGIVVEFFGHPARMHMTPALLHLKTGIPIIPEVTVRKSDDFEFDLLLGNPIIHPSTGNKERDVYEITQQLADELEALIRQNPVQWFWAPRHWLTLNRRNAAAYADWKRPVFSEKTEEKTPEA